MAAGLAPEAEKTTMLRLSARASVEIQVRTKKIVKRSWAGFLIVYLPSLRSSDPVLVVSCGHSDEARKEFDRRGGGKNTPVPAERQCCCRSANLEFIL